MKKDRIILLNEREEEKLFAKVYLDTHITIYIIQTFTRVRFWNFQLLHFISYTWKLFDSLTFFFERMIA